jgi:hypothetical protein
MTAVFPTSIPALDSGGKVNFQAGDGRLVAPTDAGPAKVRRRSTAVPDKWTFGHRAYTRAQVAELKSFYDDTLAGGVLPFEMGSPFGGTATFRFRAPISCEPVTRNTWIVSVQLEQLP